MPTKAQFEAYLKVQKSGKFNMMTDAHAAAKAAGLNMETYMCIIENYKDFLKRHSA